MPLTVKNVLPDGSEDILEVRRVSYSPAHPYESADGLTGGMTLETVYADDLKEAVLSFTEGSVYVMNSAGKTVASYRLAYPGPKPVPSQSVPA